MSKKSFTLLVIVLIAIFVAVGWYLWNGSGDPAGGEFGENVQGGLFPRGQGGLGSEEEQVPGAGNEEELPTIDLGGGAGGEAPRLRQLSTAPSAGIVAFGSGTDTVVRFMERATGHIYETAMSSTETVKISNTTLPKIHEALWGSDGSRLLIRYLKDGSVRTFYAQISASSTPETALEGLFLADNIASIAVQGTKAFYLTQDSSGSQGITAEMNGSKKAVAFASSFGDWDAVWTSPRSITLFPRPSGSAQGSAYVLDSVTGAYSKATGDALGLRAAANNDGSLVLYSASNGNGGYFTAVADVKGETAVRIGISTLVDKCAWSAKEKAVAYCAVPYSSPTGLYPDDWYKGKASFDDSLWKIDLATGETEEVFNPIVEAGVALDMFDLKLDEDERALVFRNKKDMTPWAYRLEP